MKNVTVLLIFEEPHELECYGKYLRNLGYKIETCTSLGDGMNFLETQDVALVIVSQGTRAFEGRQVVKKAHQHHPEIPVLVVARVLDMHCYLEAMDLGAFDYLERPDPQDMAWVVDTQILRAARA